MGALREFNGNTHFMSVARHGGYVYFSETTFNGLFRYKEGENEAEFLGRFPNEDLWQGDLHREVFVKGDKLYFIPMNGHGITVYDCVDGTFEMLKILGKEEEYVHFAQCVKLENEILLIPVDYGTPFTLFNIETEEIRTLPEIFEKIAKNIPLPVRYEVFPVHSTVLKDDILYLSVSSTNILLKLSLADYKVEKIVLPFEIHLRYMSFFDGVFYFTAQEHLIASWKEADNTGQIYEMPGEAEDPNYPYLKIERYNNNLYVIAGREDHFWKFNPTTGEWQDLLKKAPEEFERDLKGPLLFLGYSINKNILKLYPRAGNGFLTFDIEKGAFEFKQYLYDAKAGEELSKDWVKTILDGGRLFIEYDLRPTDYITYINENSGDNKVESNYEPAGEVIYQRILSEVTGA
ncbi:MAG: hypothetical protein IKN43_13400 [Selenomonadaceae bacterium]|nr:hypothetical protein [Selenomonadaceae bacterium]